jgi:hypothetical protein
VICRFCSQWSPSGTRRCPFCGNDPEGETDRTAGGPVQLTTEQVARLPPRHGADSDDGKTLTQQFLGSGDDEPLPRLPLVLFIGGLVAVVLGLLVRC